jgi:hypothetical protein
VNDWLVQFAEKRASSEEKLEEAIGSLPRPELLKMGYDARSIHRPTRMEALLTKMAHADRQGRELARERGNELEKIAILPLLAEALPALAAAGSRMMAGQAAKGIGTQVAKSVASGAAKGVVSSGVNAAKQNLAPAAEGGFKYANAGGALAKAFAPGGMGHKAMGFMAKNPGAAVTLAGAGAGAMMAPRDPYTGQKQYMRGALMGGGLAAGANALSQGAIADKAMGAVTRADKPILGNKARDYMSQFGHVAPAASAASAAPSALPVAKALPAGPSSSVQVDPRINRDAQKLQVSHAAARNQGTGGGGSLVAPGFFGGRSTTTVAPGASIAGEMSTKFANQQSLSYDPATRTFTRLHMTPDTSAGPDAGAIPAGHTEPVKPAAATPGYAGAAPAAPGSTAGRGQTFNMHGGSVLTSAPANPARPVRASAVPPPLPAAARSGGVLGMAGAGAMKPKLPSMAGAVSLARK